MIDGARLYEAHDSMRRTTLWSLTSHRTSTCVVSRVDGARLYGDVASAVPGDTGVSHVYAGTVRGRTTLCGARLCGARLYGDVASVVPCDAGVSHVHAGTIRGRTTLCGARLYGAHDTVVPRRHTVLPRERRTTLWGARLCAAHDSMEMSPLCGARAPVSSATTPTLQRPEPKLLLLFTCCF